MNRQVLQKGVVKLCSPIPRFSLFCFRRVNVLPIAFIRKLFIWYTMSVVNAICTQTCSYLSFLTFRHVTSKVWRFSKLKFLYFFFNLLTFFNFLSMKNQFKLLRALRKIFGWALTKHALGINSDYFRRKKHLFSP